jgi:hypothetical protein
LQHYNGHSSNHDYTDGYVLSCDSGTGNLDDLCSDTFTSDFYRLRRDTIANDLDPNGLRSNTITSNLDTIHVSDHIFESV